MADSYTSIWCTCTENSTNVANNSSNVTVNLICSTSGYADDNPNYWLKVNGNIVRSGTRNFSSGQTFTLATWTDNIIHNDDGTCTITYQGYFQGTAKPNPGNTTQLYTKTLTTLARESKFGTLVDINIETSNSFPITKNIPDAVDTLVISSGTFSKRISPYESDQSFVFDPTDLSQLYALNTTGTTVPLTLTLTTVYDGNTIGSDTKTINGTFTAQAPTVTGTISYSPTSNILSGFTTLRVRLHNLSFSPKKAATIISYTVTVDGKSVTKTSASSSTFYIFTNLTAGSKTISVQVLDSRGMSLASPKTQAITVIQYSQPTITSASATRYPGPTGTEGRLSFSGTYSATAIPSSPEYSIFFDIEEYYNDEWAIWTKDEVISNVQGYGGTLSISNGVFTVTGFEITDDSGDSEFQPTKSYKYRIHIYDNFGGQTGWIEFILGSIKTTLDIDTNTQRVGVGKFIENEDNLSLTVAGDIYEGGTKLGNKYAGYEVISQTPSSTDYSAFFNLIYPVGSIYLSMNSTNPSTLFGGTWVQIAEGQTLWSAGTNYTAGTSLEAGLPNITGKIVGTGGYGGTLGYDPSFSGVFSDTTMNGTAAWSGSHTGAYNLDFKASNSNNIYGNSSTVQPPAFVVYMFRRTA